MHRRVSGLMVAAALSGSGALGCERAPESWQTIVATSANPDFETPVRAAARAYPVDHSLPDHRWGPRASALLVHATFHLPIAAALIAACILAARHRRRAAVWGSLHVRSATRPGPAVFSGKVEAIGGNTDVPIRIVLKQAGTEWQTKGIDQHAWREVERSRRMMPFIVRCANGLGVLVNADEATLFEGPLQRTEPRSRTERLRIAEVAVGDHVVVRGHLQVGASAAKHDGYRQVRSEPTLSASPEEPLVVTTMSPGTEERRRERFFRCWALVFAGVLSLGATLVIPTYEVLSVDGRQEAVTLTAKRHWRSWHKPKNGPGYWVHHYDVRGKFLRDGTTFFVEDGCSQGLYDSLSRGGSNIVPFMVSAHLPGMHQLGTAPTVSNGRALWLALLTLASGISFWVSATHLRPWFARRSCTEFGKGPLPTWPPIM